MMRSKTRRGIEEGAGTAVLLTLAASLIYGLSSGIRANYGVLLGPISQNSGVDYASVSFALAAAQLTFGVMQPVFGLLAMRRSGPFVLCCGVGLMAAGLLALPLCRSFGTLLAVLGLVLPSGTAALAFGIVMGVLSPRLPRRNAAAASGIVTASAGVGGTVAAPVMQTLTAALGLMKTMVIFSVSAAAVLFPAAVYLCRPAGTAGTAEEPEESLRLTALVREAVKSRDYLFLLAGFFTCGFHMAIIETHFYTQITGLGIPEQTAAYAISAYGAAAMLGAILSGWLCGRCAMKNVLAALYASRVVMVLVFLMLPRSTVTVFGFAVLLGLTGNATVPPTSGLTERLFGAAKLGTLFGIVFFSHQTGSFFSAWLGGVCLPAAGGYTPVWLADAAFSAVAAAVSFKIRTGGLGQIPQ